MNIFDPHISGSLSVSGSAEFSGDIRVLGTINAAISGSIDHAVTSSFAENASLLDGIDSTQFATTGSNTFNGDQTINGNATITGNLTAQQYIVSSSVYYVTESTLSGSNTFGNDSQDYHNFTGSVNILGDLKLNGQTYTSQT